MADSEDITKKIINSFVEYAENLIDSPTVPEIPAWCENSETMLRYHNKMVALRDIVYSFANGDLSFNITARGFMAGSCKALQANLRHMIWKVQQVEQGDYTQRVDFMGDFSVAFNSMVVQLANSIETLRQKEEALTSLAVSLQEEVKKRSETLLELKKSESKFKYLAQHDPLTGTLNRRSFFPLAEARLQSDLSLGNPSCVCLLDIDHFKVFNDNYGHIEGDMVLKYVVQHSVANLRRSDIMGRYGGEEFVFFFSGADIEQGYAAAERIRYALNNNPFTLSDGKTVTVTASLGVCVILPEWRTDNTSELIQYIISQADIALYEAKSLGRNRVCLAEVTEPPMLVKK